jgi:hypothetical protein
MLSIAAMCVAGRESSYGEWWQYKLTNPIETLLSYTGIKDTSIGATPNKIFNCNRGGRNMQKK